MSAHGTFNTDWIVAYDESFLHSTYPSSLALSDLNEPGITAVDVVLTDKRKIHLKQAITNKEGMNICLNNGVIFAPENDNLVRLESTEADNAEMGTSKVLALMNCAATSITDARGVHGFNNYDDDNPSQTVYETRKPLFNLIGDSNIAPANEATLYLEELRIGWLKYTGDEDGAIVKASYSNVHFINTSILESFDLSPDLSGHSSTLSFNGKTPIEIENSNVEIKGVGTSAGGLKVAGVGHNLVNDGVDIGANGFFHMYGSETFYNQESSKQEIRNKFLGDVQLSPILNNKIRSEKAFFNLEDVYGENDGKVNVSLNLANISTSLPSAENYTDKAKGGLFYISYVNDDGTTERTFNFSTDGGSNDGLCAKTEGYGTLIYVEDFKSNLAGGYLNLTVKGKFNNSSAKYDGGLIYFNTTGEYDSRLSLTMDFFYDINYYTQNISAGENGGLVYINQENWNETYKRKNKLHLQKSAIVGNVYFDSITAGKRGGVFYITDTILTQVWMIILLVATPR